MNWVIYIIAMTSENENGKKMGMVIITAMIIIIVYM